jgi:hypothetical protein
LHAVILEGPDKLERLWMTDLELRA